MGTGTFVNLSLANSYQVASLTALRSNSTIARNTETNEGTIMKIAIPSETADQLQSIRSGHFGHTPYFTIVEYDDDMNIVSTEAVKNVDHDEFGCGGVIEYVLGLGVDGILTVGMGMPPLMRFTQGGVIVYSERETPLVGDVAIRFAQGQVDRMSPEDACSHH